MNPLPAANHRSQHAMARHISCGAIALCAMIATVERSNADCARTIADGKPRFELTEGEARDRLTGLVWQRCSAGLTWQSGMGCDGDRSALTYDQARATVRSAGATWRLPTQRELIGLIDRECGYPAIDTKVFPDVTSDLGEGAEEYWSSTPGGVGEMIATVEFYIGYTEIRSPGFTRRVRLVRTSPPANR